MKTGLSKREKVLLFLMVMIAITFLAVSFVIAPQYERYTGLQEQLETLTMDKMMTEIKLQSESSTHEFYEKAVEGYQEIAARYPRVIPNEEVDRIVTGLCVDNGLNPVNLNLSDAADYDAPRMQDDSGAEPPPAAFAVITATMTLRGNYSSLINLINSVEKIDYIRIKRISYAKGSEGGESIDVVFEMTMLKV